MKFTYVPKGYWSWRRAVNYQVSKGKRIRTLRVFWFMFTVKKVTEDKDGNNR
ncbi:hypothetical protein LCGC14_1407840 [marine sediment metagenome]|uniref:Uncharacterized protein n=1 Tax=marine sediment metagenome TaxID=412755 RepID=A0A0F9KG25_9ZZZZ